MLEIKICFAVFSFFLLCHRLSFADVVDPCMDAEDAVNDKRSPGKVARADDIPLCDAYLDSDTWYKLGGRITNECVDLMRCSTQFGIWYSGSYPTGDEIVNGKVCAKNGAGECCGWSQMISVKKCFDGSFAYKLAVPPTCPMSYCVGEYVPCPSNQVYNKKTLKCLDLPEIEKPTLGRPYISGLKTINSKGKVFNMTSFSIDCDIDVTDEHNKLAGGVTNRLKIETLFSMNGFPVATFVNDFPVSNVTLDESYLKGHLGKSLVCAVRFFYEFDDGSLSTKTDWINSTGYYFGVLPVDKNGIPLKEIRLVQDEVVQINLKATFPITTAHCFRDKTENCLLRRYDVYLENTKKGLSSTDCAISFGNILGGVTYTSSPPIELSAKNTPGPEYSRTLLKFHTFKNAISSLFDNFTITPIMVNIIEPQKQPTCYSVGDPHFSSFSEIKFDNYFTGDFNLLSAKGRSFQIQIRQIPCGNGHVTCNCGLIAREGNNIIGLTACDNRPAPLAIEMMKDNVNPHASMETNGNTYTIQFVSGVKIEATTYPWTGSTFMNIYVYGLKREEYNGICAVTAVPPDFNVFRVPYEDSFFQQKLPSCVNEVFNFPSCQCEKFNDIDIDRKVVVSCDFALPASSPNIIKLQNICDIKKASRRKKRLVDDRDDVPLIKPKNGSESGGFTMDYIFGTVNHSKDTDKVLKPTLIREEEAIAKCAEVFISSPLFQKCNETLKEQFFHLENSCIEDVKLGGDKSIANVYLSTFEQHCKQTLEKEVTVIDGETPRENNTVLDFLTEVKDVICPVCLNDGKCINGTCVCGPDFGGIDCSVDFNKPPVIRYPSNDLSCDFNTQTCHKILIEISNLHSTPNMSVDCVGRMIFMNGSEEVIRLDIMPIQPGFLHCVADDKLFDRIRKHDSHVYFILKVTTRNEKKELESNRLNLTNFDGSCLICRSDGCNLKSNDACHIDNVCYPNMYLLDANRRCDSSNSRTNWITDEENRSKSLYWVIVVSVLLVICAVATLTLLVYLPKKSAGKRISQSDEKLHLKR